MFISDIYSSKRRILLEPIYTRGECELFLSSEGLTGNREDFQNAFKKSFDYENQRREKRKIYAVFLEIMIPRDMTDEDLKLTIQFFLSHMSEDYSHLLPYCYRKTGRGNGEYVEILVGQRNIYQKEIEVPKVYKRRRYVDSVTGLFTKKDNPNAKIIEAGTPVIDKKTGKQIVFKTFVSEKKNRCWNYTTSSCEEYRKEVFSRFTDGLEAAFKVSISKVYQRKAIPQKKIEWNYTNYSWKDHSVVKAKCIHLNRYIKKTKSELDYLRGDMLRYRAMTGYVSDMNISDMFRDYANMTRWIAETLNTCVVGIDLSSSSIKRRKIKICFNPYIDWKNPREKSYKGRNSYRRWMNRFACAKAEIEGKIDEFKSLYRNFIGAFEQFSDFCERTRYTPLSQRSFEKCFRYEGKRFLV